MTICSAGSGKGNVGIVALHMGAPDALSGREKEHLKRGGSFCQLNREQTLPRAAYRFGRCRFFRICRAVSRRCRIDSAQFALTPSDGSDRFCPRCYRFFRLNRPEDRSAAAVDAFFPKLRPLESASIDKRGLSPLLSRCFSLSPVENDEVVSDTAFSRKRYSSFSPIAQRPAEEGGVIS